MTPNQQFNFVAEDPTSKAVLDLATIVARAHSTVLISGESGVGKTVLARFIHLESPRADSPFVAVSCAGIAGDDFEFEMFGSKIDGIGSEAEHVGRFSRAMDGTIYLNEISELSRDSQTKLLGVIQEREYRPVGATSSLPFNARLIASTTQDLPQLVDEGAFREDLYYRLNVFPIHIPPLRQRRGDIPILASHLGRVFADVYHGEFDVDDTIIEFLSGLELRGNVRELSNLIERAVVLATQQSRSLATIDYLRSAHEFESAGSVQRESGSEASLAQDSDSEATIPFWPEDDELTDVRQRAILKTLQHYNGNRSRSAEALGISVRTMHKKIRDYRAKGVNVPEPGEDS